MLNPRPSERRNGRNIDRRLVSNNKPCRRSTTRCTSVRYAGNRTILSTTPRNASTNTRSGRSSKRENKATSDGIFSGRSERNCRYLDTVNIFDTFMTASMKEDYAMTESGEVIVTLDGGKFEVIEDG